MMTMYEINHVIMWESLINNSISMKNNETSMEKQFGFCELQKTQGL